MTFSQLAASRALSELGYLTMKRASRPAPRAKRLSRTELSRQAAEHLKPQAPTVASVPALVPWLPAPITELSGPCSEPLLDSSSIANPPKPPESVEQLTTDPTPNGVYDLSTLVLLAVVLSVLELLKWSRGQVTGPLIELASFNSPIIVNNLVAPDNEPVVLPALHASEPRGSPTHELVTHWPPGDEQKFSLVTLASSATMSERKDASSISSEIPSASQPDHVDQANASWLGRCNTLLKRLLKTATITR